MTFDKDTLSSYLIYSKPIPYNEQITLSPVRMENYFEFLQFSKCLTVRKDSWFPEKRIIKMNYYDFLYFALMNPEFCEEYKMPELSRYYVYLLYLLQLCCPEHEIKYSFSDTHMISINGCILNAEIIDDLRRIIILQNNIDFDIDEFLNKDTEDSLIKAQNFMQKNQDVVTVEDYVDSLCIILQCNESEIGKLPIRKFWRYIKRSNLRDNYMISKSAEMSGMVTFKQPIPHWMTSVDNEDKYNDVKMDEKSLKDKVASANG